MIPFLLTDVESIKKIISRCRTELFSSITVAEKRMNHQERTGAFLKRLLRLQIVLCKKIMQIENIANRLLHGFKFFFLTAMCSQILDWQELR